MLGPRGVAGSQRQWITSTAPPWTHHPRRLGQQDMAPVMQNIE